MMWVSMTCACQAARIKHEKITRKKRPPSATKHLKKPLHDSDVQSHDAQAREEAKSKQYPIFTRFVPQGYPQGYQQGYPHRPEFHPQGYLQIPEGGGPARLRGARHQI